MRNSNRLYTYRSSHQEREYGLYWYSGLWRVLRPVLIALAVAALVAGICTTVWNRVYAKYAAPTDPGDSRPVLFRVEPGSSLTRVANNLEEAGLIRSATVFKYYSDFAGLGQKLQPGTYSFSPDMEMTAIAEALTMGDGVPIVRNVTLIPGWTVEDFAASLEEKGAIDSAASFLAKCKTGSDFMDYTLVADLRNVSSRKYALEGYLAADTYEFYLNATEDDIIRRMLSQTDKLFSEAWLERTEALGMDVNQVLTLASLIEKEAKTADFAKVSAVFHNRLRAGMPLQSDVTIHYITGVRKMALAGSDLTVSNPFNTYANKGLPPGPICSPSAAAIQAALYPDETYLAQQYLYFCAKDPDSGALDFSRTLAEHEQKVAVYAPLWKARDEEMGIQ